MTGPQPNVRPMRRPLTDYATRVVRYTLGRWRLRRCTAVGRRPTVTGRLVIENDGAIRIGDHVVFRATHLPIELLSLPGGQLTIGDRCFINSGVSISAQCSVTIGNDVKIGMQSLILDTDFHEISDHHLRPSGRPVTIGDGAWLAARVTVLKGVTIGRGAVVAAGAVVTKDVEAHTVVAGVPARLVRRIPSESNVADAR